MNYKAFENLELIPRLLEKLESIESELEYLTPDLTKRSGVAQYLKVSEKTLDNYRNDGRFKENEHYYVKNGKITFVENAIKDFRKTYHSKNHFILVKKGMEKLRNEIL